MIRAMIGRFGNGGGPRDSKGPWAPVEAAAEAVERAADPAVEAADPRRCSGGGRRTWPRPSGGARGGFGNGWPRTSPNRSRSGGTGLRAVLRSYGSTRTPWPSSRPFWAVEAAAAEQWKQQRNQWNPFHCSGAAPAAPWPGGERPSKRSGAGPRRPWTRPAGPRCGRTPWPRTCEPCGWSWTRPSGGPRKRTPAATRPSGPWSSSGRTYGPGWPSSAGGRGGGGSAGSQTLRRGSRPWTAGSNSGGTSDRRGGGR